MATDPRAFVALLLLLFILFSPDPQAQNPQHQPVAERESLLVRERRALDVLNATQYGDFDPAQQRWLNLSGFAAGPDDEWGWAALGAVKERARALTGYALGAVNVVRLDRVLAQTSEELNGGALDGVGKELVKGQDALPLYRNVSGVVHGSWVRSPLEKSLELGAPVLNMSAYAPEGPFGAMPLTGFGRNETGQGGSLRVRFDEGDGAEMMVQGKAADGEDFVLARSITALVGSESEEGSGWEALLHGLHYPETGNMVLTTTSDKFMGIFGLPHLTVSGYAYRAAQELLNHTIGKTLDQRTDGFIRRVNPWTSNTDGTSDSPFSMPNCELVVYAQQHLAPAIVGSQKGMQSSLLRFMEQELRFPTGAFLPSAYEMRISMLIFSPDCGFVLESKGEPESTPEGGNHLVGPKIEVEYARGRHHLLMFAVVLAMQLWLLTRQMRDASTPSTRSRVSFYTISILSMGDGFTTMTFCLISLFIPNLWVPLIATSFMAFLSVSFFGMRFLMDIWGVQAPERERSERQRLAAAAAARAAPAPAQQGTTQTVQPAVQMPVLTPAGAESLPLPVTARRPVDTGATPIILPADQDEPPDEIPSTTQPATQTAPTPPFVDRGPGFGALYTRFYFLLLATLFLSLNATSWPSSYRRLYFTLLAFVYLSFWLPQIQRNCMRNCRRALRWDFVAGQSLLRLVPFVYFYGYGGNVLFASVDLVDLALLATWVWIQAVTLVSQELVGPRWFVKNAWVPPAYDYHPVLREDEEGGNLPVGFAQAAAAADFDSAGQSGAKAGEGKEKGRRVFDCAICMQDLEVAVLGPNGVTEGGLAGNAGGLLARRAYMVTPCRHIFHSQCLEGWMKYRLQCPICREGLPPL